MKELVEKRTLRSKVFDLGDGRHRVTASLAPLHIPDDVQAWNANKRGNHFWSDPDRTFERRGKKFALKNEWFGLEVHQGLVGYTYLSKLTGAKVTVELLEVGGKAPSAPAPRAVGDEVWFDRVAEDLDIYLKIQPGKVELFKKLHSANAPKQLVWQTTETGTGLQLQRKTFGHDNADLADASRNGAGVGRLRRALHMAEPVISSEIKGADTVTRLAEEWTGKTIALDADRVPSLSDEVSWPVLIDTTVNEVIAANGDDGNQRDSSGQPWYDQYGSTGDHIIYDTPSGSRRVPGWRFQTVAIPQGSTVNSASLVLNVAKVGGGAAGTTATVFGNNVDDAPAWGDNAGPLQMAQTTANASFGAWGAGASLGTKTITVTTIVQEIVNRVGWVSGNDIALAALFTGTNNGAYSYMDDLAGGATNIAQLNIDYGAAGGSASITPTTGSLGFTGRTPTVTNGGITNTTRTPTAGSLGFTGQQPTMTLTVAAPGVGALALTGQAPSLLINAIRTPSVGALGFTGSAPGVANSGGSQSISPGVGTLSSSGQAPSLLTNFIRIPNAGALAMTPIAATLSDSGGSRSISPGVGALTFGTQSPNVSNSGQVGGSGAVLAAIVARRRLYH